MVDNEINSDCQDARHRFAQLMQEQLKKQNLNSVKISQVTRINLGFIEALLNGNFDELPGQIFGRGFVKNICKVLKVDGEEILKLYDAGFKNAAEETPEDFVQATKKRGSSISKLKHDIRFDLIYEKFIGIFQKRLVSIGLTAGLVLALSLEIVFLSRVDSEENSTASVENMVGRKTEEKQIVEELKQESEKIEEHQIDKVIVQKTEAEETIAAEIEQKNEQEDEGVVDAVAVKPVESKKPQVTSNISEKKVEQISAVDSAEVAKNQILPTGGSELQVLVSEKVRLRIKVDGGRTDVLDLKPGTYSYTITSKAELMVFNAAAVQMVFGGRKLGDLGRKGRIRKLVFRVDEKQSH